MSDFGMGDCNEADVLDALRWHAMTERPEAAAAVIGRPLAMSWSGSERQRREQLPCSPPAFKGTWTPRFRIPAGTELSICSVEDNLKQWQRHVTKRELSFERYEYYNSGAYTFREQGYFVLVRASKVIQRKRE